MTPENRVEDLLRDLAPQVLGALVRRHGQFDACEDAVQEALLAAARQWPPDGVPDRPRSWLLTVAGRALVDQWRADSARRRREQAAAALDPAGREPAADPVSPGHGPVDADDSLVLLFLCCHPALSPASQLALTLRAVGGLTTTEIAAAFLVPEATMAKRISRAKQHIKAAGARFTLPPQPERTQRLGVVLHALYLLFNEGYTTSSGTALHRPDLAGEAIRLTRLLYRLLPDQGEVAGLLALMLLTDSRRAARTAPIGPYQVQAAIAAVHDEAPAAEQTDWPQILALYDVLAHLRPGPMVTLSRAVALANIHGPRAGLAVLGTLTTNDQIANTHRLHAVRAHLLELADEPAAARKAYLHAARLTASVPEQRYLTLRAARLHHPAGVEQTRYASSGAGGV